VDVYFDDLSVDLETGPVVLIDGNYPYGTTFQGRRFIVRLVSLGVIIYLITYKPKAPHQNGSNQRYCHFEKSHHLWG